VKETKNVLELPKTTETVDEFSQVFEGKERKMTKMTSK
jgi:hypothetical protein